MNDVLIFALLFSAIAIGWLLGRRSSRRLAAPPELPSQYYAGLNYLLDDHPDGAIDGFIDALGVNNDTLETHVAIGNLLRKRGEVDRAIRVHQNLLAQPSLPRTKVHQAHLELARDYISAGLLDRAERLLLDLVKESVEQRVISRRHLLEIYTSEKEWQRAIEIGGEMLPRKTLLPSAATTQDSVQGQQVTVALAHFYCELATEELISGELQIARKMLNQALLQDPDCVRASLMRGELEHEAGHYTQAIQALRKVRQQDVDYLPETLALLRSCHQKLDDEDSLKAYLQESLGDNPSPKLLLAVAEDITKDSGKAAAAEFLSSRLAHQPSLRGLAKLIELQLDGSDGKSSENLGLLQLLVNRLVSERPVYRCGHCGFSGRQLHWFCPGCKYWGTMKSIQSGGIE